jgi:hypothetical protein
MAHPAFVTAQANRRLLWLAGSRWTSKDNVRLGPDSAFGNPALVIDTFTMTGGTAFNAEFGFRIRRHTMGRMQYIGGRRIFMTAQTGFNADFGRVRRALRRTAGQWPGKTYPRHETEGNKRRD